MNHPKITLSVTTYNRPKYLKDLIASYLFQKKPFPCEMVIVDDCPDDTETPILVAQFQKKDPSIRYIKNKTNIGYSKNYLKSIDLALGEYVITVGDDDVLINQKALVHYCNIFEKNPSVGFIYGNILQFNKNYQMDYAYFHFKQDSFFSGQDAIHNIWLKSCFIGGIGLRKSVDFSALYPSEHKLFPQVEMIGKLLLNWDGYGTKEFIVAARAHEDQLGFAALKGNRIKKKERESSIELFEMYKILRNFFQKNGKYLSKDTTFISEDLIRNNATFLPTQKINTGNILFIQKNFDAVKKNPRILVDLKYIFFFFLSLFTPRKILFSLKEGYKRYLVKKIWFKEERIFDQSFKKIKKYKSYC